MIHETTLYDAFTGMSPAEKSTVVNFLCEHTNNASKQSVREALEYAIKSKPSFGGFVLTAHTGRQMIAAVIVNRTGMEGYNPKNLLVFATFHNDYRDDEAMMLYILRKAIELADGDMALHLEPRHPALKLYKKLGFQATYLELRLPQSHNVAIA